MGGDEDLLPVRPQPEGHAEGGGDRLAGVVGGIAHHVQLQQFGHHAGVLEDGLHLAVVGVGVPAVGGEKLRAVGDLVAHGGDVALIAPGPQEAEGLRGGGVLGQQAVHVALESLLTGDGVRQVHLPLKQQVFGDHRAVDLRHVPHADLPQHLPFNLGDAVGHIGVNEMIRQEKIPPMFNGLQGGRSVQRQGAVPLFLLV